MPIIKCCVGGCEATKGTHRLFRFPKDDELRKLWLSFVVPTNPLLNGLTKDQLIIRNVCERHFDRQQFNHYDGTRLKRSYPCLFTKKEITHGVPLTTKWSVRLEHNYSKEDEAEENVNSETPMIEITETTNNNEKDLADPLLIENNVKIKEESKQTGLLPKELVPGMLLRCIPKELVPKKILRSVPKELLSGKVLRPVPTPPVLEKIEIESDFKTISNKDDNNYPNYVQDNLAQKEKSNAETSLCVKPKQNIDKGFCKDTVKKDLDFQQDLLGIKSKKLNRLKRIKILKHEVMRQRKVIKSLEEKLSVRNNHFNSNGEIDKIKCLGVVTKNMSETARIFTKMQTRAMFKPRGRQFDIKEKVLALTIYKTNKKCYELLRNYFVLPCPRSLVRLLAGYTLKGKSKEREEDSGEGQTKVTEE